MSARVAPWLGRALIMLLAYVVVVPGGELLSGVDLQTPFGTAASVVKGRGAGSGWASSACSRSARIGMAARRQRAARIAAFLARGGLWIVPALLGAVIVVALATAPWGDWTAGLVVLLLVGMLLIGTGEELVSAATSSSARAPDFGARRVPVHVRAVWAHPRRKRDHRPSARRDHRADDPGHDPGHVVLSAAAHERCADRADRRARALELLVVPARIGSVEDRGRRARCAAKAAAENYARASRCCTDALALWAA